MLSSSSFKNINFKIFYFDVIVRVGNKISLHLLLLKFDYCVQDI